MARKKAPDSGGAGGGEWLNTYADMVTLLLTFFILLFSMSTLDSTKFNLVVKAFTQRADLDSKISISTDLIENTFDGPAPPDDMSEDALQKIVDSLVSFIALQGVSESVSVSQGDGYVFIQFMDDMLFEPNSTVLKPSDREILRFVGNGIKSVQDQCEEISIHGFTASVPNNPDYPVNEWQLSTGRANAVLVYFDDVIGIDKTKMTATGWGMNHPFDTNDTPEGQARNRRVEILLSTENLLSEQLDNIYEKLVE